MRSYPLVPPAPKLLRAPTNCYRAAVLRSYGNLTAAMQACRMAPADAVKARDATLRRTRGIVAGVAAGAVAASGLLSVVAAQAFKGHAATKATTAATRAPERRAHRVPVPRPQSIPAIAGDPAPLAPPAQTPTPVEPQPSAPAPDPQVSGGS